MNEKEDLVIGFAERTIQQLFGLATKLATIPNFSTSDKNFS